MARSIMLLFVLLAAFASLSVAKTVTYNFNVGWVSAAPDGYTRPVIGINGQWPIPTIEANEGDTIVVNVQNNLGNQSTSLHFHGMYQIGTSSSDGGVGLGQCPIPAGGSYTYQFVATPAGTHWYHSHDKGQYPDGLRGKMIIHDPAWENSLDIDSQIYLSMSDWYHTQQAYLINNYLSTSNTDGRIPSPDSFLVNDTRAAPTLNFVPGKKYLIRIVNFGSLACNWFHIDGHKLTVVGIDGVQTKPQDADTILICVGQRYDVVVQAMQKPTSSYKYIAKLSTDMFTDASPGDDVLTVTGTVAYNLLGKVLDSIFNLLSQSWVPQAVQDDFTLQPLDGQKLLTSPKTKIYYQSNQTYYTGVGSRISVGAQPWTEPKTPSLYTALTTGNAANDPSTYGVGVDPWVATYGDTVQIYHYNPQPFPHPMHLHGHEFQTVARGSGTWDGNEASLPSIPMKRDVVVIPANGYFVLRYQANNPGVWFYHCHIDLHLVGGMGSTIVEAPQQLQANQRIPANGASQCTAGGYCASGNCACQRGAISASDSVTQCNTIFNSNTASFGAQTGPLS